MKYLIEKKQGAFKDRFLKFILIPEVTSVIPVILVALIAIVLNPVFLRGANLLTLGSSLIASWGLLAIGQAFIVMAGELDISVGASFSFGAMFLCFLARAGVPLWLCFLGVFAACMTVGLINAALVLRFNVPTFIATLSTSYVCKGLANVVNYGADLSVAPLANTNAVIKAFITFGKVKPLGLSLGAWVFIIIIFVAQFIVKKTAFGRRVFAVGDNKQVAKVAGIRVNRIKTICYVIVGFMVALTAILWVGYYSGSMAAQGVPWTFVTVSAVAMGGVSLKGGSGSMYGVFCGVLLMALIYNLITLLGIDSNYQNIFIGSFLALAVILDAVRREKTIGKNI